MKIYIFIMTSLFLSACTTVSYNLHPRSHYHYPNSNVKPLGEAVGSVSKVSLFARPQEHGEIQRKAVKEALQQNPTRTYSLIMFQRQK